VFTEVISTYNNFQSCNIFCNLNQYIVTITHKSKIAKHAAVEAECRMSLLECLMKKKNFGGNLQDWQLSFLWTKTGS
jgi:hypothetical protein